MGADKSAKNTPKFIGQNCLPKPKSLGFRWKKASLGVRSLWLECTKMAFSLKVLCWWSLLNHPINHANVSWFFKKKLILVFFVLGLSRRWTRTDCSLRSAIGQCSRCQKYGSDVVAFEKLGSWAGAKKPWNHARYSPPQASPSKSKNYANATWWRPINRNWIRGM